MMADQFETLRIIDQCGKVDQIRHGQDTTATIPQSNQPNKAGSWPGKPDQPGPANADGSITPESIMSHEQFHKLTETPPMWVRAVP